MAEQPRGKANNRSQGKARHESQLKPKKKFKKPKTSRQRTDNDTTLTEIRKKIRSLEKLLAHDAEVAKAALEARNNNNGRSMPSQIRQEKERALAGYKHDLDIALAKASKTKYHSRMISRYHAVRFFERKKAERNLKRAKTALEKGEGSEEAVLNAQTDLNYSLYLPLSEKYVSLWPQDRGDDPDNVRGGSSWKHIRNAFVQATDEGMTKEQIEDELLKIRDEGWGSRTGAESLLRGPQDSVAKAGNTPRNAHIPLRKKSKKSKTAPVAVGDSGQKGIVGADSDSDGFFER